MKPNIKEVRRLSASAVRQLCINHRWYTCGTTDEYAAMFDKLYDESGFEVDITAEKLFDIATDIYKHSKIEDYTVDAIMNVLAKACCYYYEFDREELRYGND